MKLLELEYAFTRSSYMKDVLMFDIYLGWDDSTCSGHDDQIGLVVDQHGALTGQFVDSYGDTINPAQYISTDTNAASVRVNKQWHDLVIPALLAAYDIRRGV